MIFLTQITQIFTDFYCAFCNLKFEFKKEVDLKSNALAVMEGKILFFNYHGFKPVAIEKKIGMKAR